jgi:hypothetical protein
LWQILFIQITDNKRIEVRDISRRMSEEENGFVQDQCDVKKEYDIDEKRGSYFAEEHKILVYEYYDQTSSRNQVLD